MEMWLIAAELTQRKQSLIIREVNGDVTGQG